MDERDFVSGLETADLLADPNVLGVFERHVPLVEAAIQKLGCVALMNEEARRRGQKRGPLGRERRRVRRARPRVARGRRVWVPAYGAACGGGPPRSPRRALDAPEGASRRAATRGAVPRRRRTRVSSRCTRPPRTPVAGARRRAHRLGSGAPPPPAGAAATRAPSPAREVSRRRVSPASLSPADRFSRDAARVYVHVRRRRRRVRVRRERRERRGGTRPKPKPTGETPRRAEKSATATVEETPRASGARSTPSRTPKPVPSCRAFVVVPRAQQRSRRVLPGGRREVLRIVSFGGDFLANASAPLEDDAARRRDRAQARRSSGALVPALARLPVVSVPADPADSRGTPALGWQNPAAKIGSGTRRRALGMARRARRDRRYAHVPLGNLGTDWCLHVADTFFARALRDSAPALWTGPGARPDFGGGASDGASVLGTRRWVPTRAGGCAPGAYRCVCASSSRRTTSRCAPSPTRTC